MNIIFANVSLVPALLVVLVFNSLLISSLVSVSGYIFKSTVEQYATGKLITRVQLNVLVICICFCLRCLYDVIKVSWYEGFDNMRKAAVDNPKQPYYTMFYVSLVLVVEYFPILLFSLNMNFVYSASLKMQAKQVTRMEKMKKEEE